MYTQLLLCLIILILLIKYIMNIIETKIIFQPDKIKQTDIENIKSIKLLYYYLQPIKNIKIITDDAIVLDAMYYFNPKINKLIIHAHGNAGNIYCGIEFIEKYKQFGSVLIFDYRGYGLSSGKPSEKGLHADILSVWRYATKKLKFNSSDITLYGTSLGCSVILWLSKHLHENYKKLPRAIIIDSGFYNIKTLACDYIDKKFRHFIQSKFNNIKYINKIKKHVPILLIHSYQDDIIDISHAYKIIKDAEISFKNFILISGSHNNPIFTPQDLERITKFLQ